MLRHATYPCRAAIATAMAAVALSLAIAPAMAAPRAHHRMAIPRSVHGVSIRVHARLVHPFRHARHVSRGGRLHKPAHRVGRHSRTVAHSAAFVNGAWFNGTSEGSCCVDPPGISGAVGLFEFVQVDAKAVSVFDRLSGALIVKTSFSNFCGGLSDSAQGRVAYDRPADRWYFVGLSGSILCFAVSVTDDATGGWYQYLNGSVFPPGGFALNPMIGYDQDSVLITTDAYDSGSHLAATTIVAVNKALAVLGNATAAAEYSLPGPVVPPIVDDFSSTSDDFLGATPSGSTLILGKGTQLDHFPTGQISVTAVPVSAYSAPPPASQPGTADTLNAGNASFQGPSTQIGDSLFNVHGIAVNGHPGIRWYQINAATPAVVTSGLVSGSTATADNLDPSMAAAMVNGSPTEFFSWTMTDSRSLSPASQHPPEMALGVRSNGGPANVVASTHSGPGSNYAPAPGENGWGFSQVSIDPDAASGCPVGDRAFAIGAMGQTAQLWRARIWSFGMC